MAKKNSKNTEVDEVAFDVNNYSGGLKAAIEAILIVISDPVDPVKLATVLASNVEDVEKALVELKAEYSEQMRGFELNEFDGLWRFYSTPEYGEAVSKFIIGSSESKLSVAALETLAIVAYNQPVTRHEIATIRGVNVDGVVRTLLQRGFIQEVNVKGGDQDERGNKYVTTPLFLEKVGIKSLDELEPLAPFLPEDIQNIPQFDDIRKSSRSVATSETLDVGDVQD
ncbi:MAG: SMC-Scp complex subunit ScpB [Candidatus Ancillula sp.]|jgi:segregation and condensation protein B|nr:SMC-Scp complex subunit ScpB [Candidatus Ancillula sp.]